MTHRQMTTLEAGQQVLTPDLTSDYRPPYPVPPVPGPVPWWRFGKRLQQAADAQAAHVARLVTLVDLHRQLLAAEQQGRVTERALERCRNWNTALLKDKHEQAATIAALTEQVASLQQRVDDAVREMLAADKRDRESRRAVEDSERAHQGVADNLQRALKRCDDLAAKLRSRRKR